MGAPACPSGANHEPRGDQVAGDAQRSQGSESMTDSSADVFLSYRRGERELVASLARRLEARGVTCRYDAGVAADASADVSAQRETARILAVLFSEEMNADPGLARQTAAADRGGRPVVLILTEETQPRGRLLRVLAERTWIKAYPDPMGLVENLVDLLSAIAGKAPASAPSARVASPETTQEAPLEARQASLDETISQLMHDSLDTNKAAPTHADAYIGRLQTAGGGVSHGIGQTVLSVVTLGLYGAFTSRRAIATFRSNIRKL